VVYHLFYLCAAATAKHVHFYQIDLCSLHTIHPLVYRGACDKVFRSIRKCVLTPNVHTQLLALTVRVADGMTVTKTTAHPTGVLDVLGRVLLLIFLQSLQHVVPQGSALHTCQQAAAGFNACHLSQSPCTCSVHCLSLLGYHAGSI
jgi:hypothetical protein